MKLLQREFSRKEKTEKILHNLENLKREGKIPEEQYDLLREKYSEYIREAENLISRRKQELQEEVSKLRKNIELYSKTAKNLEIRFKVGELRAEQYLKESQKVRKSLSKMEEAMTLAQKCINAKSSDHVGGFLDINLEQKSKSFALKEMPSLENIVAPIDYLHRAIGIIKNPAQYFDRIVPEQGMYKPIIFGISILFLSSVFMWITKHMTLLFPIVYWGATVIALFLSAAILLVLSKINNGKADYESSFRIMAYSTTPLVVTCIPYISIVALLYALYIMFAGIERVHSLPRTRSMAISCGTGGLIGLYAFFILPLRITPVLLIASLCLLLISVLYHIIEWKKVIRAEVIPGAGEGKIAAPITTEGIVGKWDATDIVYWAGLMTVIISSFLPFMALRITVVFGGGAFSGGPAASLWTLFSQPDAPKFMIPFIIFIFIYGAVAAFIPKTSVPQTPFWKSVGPGCLHRLAGAFGPLFLSIMIIIAAIVKEVPLGLLSFGLWIFLIGSLFMLASAIVTVREYLRLKKVTLT